MTTQDEERLRRIQQALAQYLATLASVSVVGFGRSAELDQLADLIRLHPDEARSMLDDRDEPS